MTKQEAVKHVYYWQYSHKHNDPATNFTSRLLDLFRKADRDNYAKLKSAYPELVDALELWDNSPDGGDELFTSHGFKV